MSELTERVLSGDIRALARAATVVENRRPEAVALMRGLFPHTGRALIIGVTGSPGAGKSTLVDHLARSIRACGTRVGILAVDPTSPYSGGAILGDRIRMQSHHADPGVFIRSMATRGAVGGLAPATMDLALLLDAAGFGAVIVETVGVGQDEVDVARLADITLVVLVPGMGDDVQAIKAGIMEIADVFLINKADQPGSARLERELKAAIGLAVRRGGWIPPIVSTVASEGKGIDRALAAIQSYRESGLRKERAAGTWALRLREMLREKLMERLPAAEIEAAAREVAARTRDPYTIVDEWLKRI